MIVLDRERTKKVQGDILRTYDIAHDRPTDLLAVLKVAVKAK